MKINRIELCNFGSYAGKCVFDLHNGARKGNIILIGGKNGAGKTTLFSGIKLCLYGNKSEGFESVNAFYRKEVRKYINDVSKFESTAECYVKVNVLFSNGQNEDEYEMMRKWNNSASLLEDFEEFTVTRNGLLLTEEELADFDNYVMNIIPPELFDLFFFDGEQIADYFLGADGNERVKNAFMILCGYDTFDIMQKNFKRLTYGKHNADSTTEINYVEAKRKADECERTLREVREKLEQLKSSLDTINLEIKTFDKKYKLSGGVTYSEWNEKLIQLKEEERRREEKNAQLKKLANEAIPFIIVRSMLVKLAEQLKLEHDKQQFELLQESLRTLLPEIMKKVYTRLEWQNDTELTSLVIEEFDAEMHEKHLSEVENIVNITGEEYFTVQTAISKYLDIDKKVVSNLEREIQESIEKSQELREEIDKCDLEGVQEYLEKKTELTTRVSELTEKLQIAIEDEQRRKEEYDLALAHLKREERKFDEETKNNSIINLSERSVAFLDELQRRLYKNEIQKVEELFMMKIRELARKNRFIDSIMIDSDFNVHIYKKITFSTKSVCNRMLKMGIPAYITEYGTVHCQGLIDSTSAKDLADFIRLYSDKSEKVTVLQEIEKSRLSKGEKQVFIMALYWAFMQLNKQEVPFVIDTPFARIDSEHRANITKKFFMDLSGQVFIFSTNEEIVGEHYEQMKKKIRATFLLENVDNLQTTVKANEYFGG